MSRELQMALCKFSSCTIFIFLILSRTIIVILKIHELIKTNNFSFLNIKLKIPINTKLKIDHIFEKLIKKITFLNFEAANIIRTKLFGHNMHNHLSRGCQNI